MSDPERLRLSIIVALETELSCLGSWDVESCLPRLYGEPDLGFLYRSIKGIVCGDGDGRRYVGIGVALVQVIAARRSSQRLFMLILVGRVLPIFYISCVLCFSY